MAGESAQESARKQRAKAERLLRSAQMYERGAAGEEATADVLKALPAEQWAVVHDVHWPGRRFANVDHVVVGPPGIFVIDSKNWSGSVGVRDDVLRHNGYKREAEVAAAAEAAIAVSALAPSVSPRHVYPVLCFVRDEPVFGWARDVMLCSTTNLIEMLTTRPLVLTDESRNAACIELGALLRPMSAPPTVARARSHDRRRTRPTARRGRRRRPARLLPGLVSVILCLTLIPVGITALGKVLQSIAQASLAVTPSRSGACAPSAPVKGVVLRGGAKIYRQPTDRLYDQAKAAQCFRTVAAATAHGYVAP